MRAISLVLVAAPCVGIATNACAQNVDLADLGNRGFRIEGIDASDFAGRSVSGAGDVNGDGLADLIIGAYAADPSGDSYGGEAYVVFGKASSTPVDLAALGDGGFRINGVDSGDFAGTSVSGAGDVNGDGLADLIVGASGAGPGGVMQAGEAYVVFGKATPTTVDLTLFAGGGFRIDGIGPDDLAGRSVSGAGDVNGDGLADVIVGAFLANPGGSVDAGEAYVVFGKPSETPVDLAALGAGGFRIYGIDDCDYAGYSVSGAGDINGDGLADLIVGAPTYPCIGAGSAGAAYLVFGKADNTAIDLSALGTGGFRIEGINTFDYTGRSVSGAGDVNGDGLADLIVGAPGGDSGSDSNAGEAYVVFGKASDAPVDLAALGAEGFRIEGIDAFDYAGASVSGAGDINGDGLADLIVGAYGGDPGDESAAGEAYVVFGKASNTSVDLAALGAQGYRIDGINSGDHAGTSVSGAGDVNGDGLADLIVGAPNADPGGESAAGGAYVVFSDSMPLLSVSVRAHSGNGDSPRTAFGVSGDGSNDGTPDARAWIDFADGDDPELESSTEIVALTRSSDAFPSPGANVSWRLQTTRQDWTSAELRMRYLDSELLDNENLLEVVYSATGTAPFTPLASVVNPQDNTISAVITQPGYFFLGSRSIFADGFE